jgi:hypothetical protein
MHEDSNKFNFYSALSVKLNGNKGGNWRGGRILGLCYKCTQFKSWPRYRLSLLRHLSVMHLRFSRHWRSKSRSSGLWRRVVLWWDTNVSEDLSPSPWRWRQHWPPKRWCPTTKLHGVTNQKTSPLVLGLHNFPRRIRVTFLKVWMMSLYLQLKQRH